MPFAGATQLLITVHPSALLRVPDELKAKAYRRFVADLRTIREFLEARIA